jgi:hypothetical protein
MEVVQARHFDHGRYRTSIALDETDLARILTNKGIPLARLKDMPEVIAYQLLTAEATVFNNHAFLRFLAKQPGFDPEHSDTKNLKGEIATAKTEIEAALAQLRALEKPKAARRSTVRNGGGKAAAGETPEKEPAGQ